MNRSVLLAAAVLIAATLSCTHWRAQYLDEALHRGDAGGSRAATWTAPRDPRLGRRRNLLAVSGDRRYDPSTNGQRGAVLRRISADF